MTHPLIDPMMNEGILPINKPAGKTSFALVTILRQLTKIRTIGHAGTLDPFATGVMVLLIGKRFTTLSSQFLGQDKEYIATVHLGIETTTYDPEGEVTATSPLIPSLSAIDQALLQFQGTISQTPPMFSAKKVQGKKLYELARKGIVIERHSVPVTLDTTLLDYSYPFLSLKIRCSKGTYIRSIAHDLGKILGCGAHLSQLTRTKSGSISLDQCCNGAQLNDPSYNWRPFLCSSLP